MKMILKDKILKNNNQHGYQTFLYVVQEPIL
jgi:hypothetical protein